jgi:hypothetical protein
MLALNTECAMSGEFNTTSHSYRERKQLFSYLMEASKQVLHDKNVHFNTHNFSGNGH